MRTKFLRIGALVVSLVFGAACKKQPVPVAEAVYVAKVGEARISPEDFSRELARRNEALTVEKRETVLRNMIRVEALAARAKEEGFDRDPETAARVKKLIAAMYEEKLRGGEFRETNSPAELREYYEAHAATFVTPERARAAMIFWQVPKKAAEEKRKESLAKAEAVAGEAGKLPPTDKGFGELARANSEDQATRYAGGDLGWKSEAELASRFGPEIAKTVFELKEGSMSGVMSGAEGLYLFKGIERQERQNKGFEEVKELVAYRLTRQKKDESDRQLEEKITSGMKIEIDRAALEQVAPVTNAVLHPPRAPGA